MSLDLEDYLVVSALYRSKAVVLDFIVCVICRVWINLNIICSKNVLLHWFIYLKCIQIDQTERVQTDNISLNNLSIM